VISEIANQPPPPPKLAGELEPVLRRMLDSDPHSRWSMVDAAHALHRIADRHSERTRATTTAAFAGAGAGASTSAWAEDTGPSRSATTTTTRTSPAPVAEAPTQPRQTPPSDGNGSRRRRRGPLLVLLAAVALLLVGGFALAALTGEDPADKPTASESPKDEAPTSDKPSSSPASSPTSSPEQTTSPSATATKGDRVGFLEDYFGTVPGDLDAGWSMLSPRMQAEVGRDSYDGFWGTVSSVRASDFSPRGNTVDLTLRYTMDDGRVEAERHRIELVRDGGGYLIDDDTPVG
jgi:eukaryotic-like serine/threonine-protein kinase